MNISETIRLREKEHFLSFHTPGHKGKNLGYAPCLADDVTELTDTDDLHNPKGIIKDSMKLAAKLYGSKASFFSTNGSTTSNMAAIDAVTKTGDSILICGLPHVSVENITVIKHLNPIYLTGKPLNNEYPDIESGISAKEIEQKLLKYPDIKAVFITSPNYEGILSNIEEIAEKVHQHNLPLIVDEAHGAHLALSPSFPKSALHSGADIVINSLHKTLPAITGTSILHLSKNSIPEKDRVQKSLLRLLSTSPSYLMLNSIDSCLHLLDKEGKFLFEHFTANLKAFYQDLEKLKNLSLLAPPINKWSIKDPSRLVILSKHKDLSGHKLYQILRNNYKIEMERSSERYIIGISTIADSEYDFNTLKNALLDIDHNIDKDYYHD